MPLSALILLTYTANATDAHDHFYAILGLAPETDKSALVSDYTKSLKEVCSQFVSHIIETENRLDILMFNHSNYKADLPHEHQTSQTPRAALVYGGGRIGKTFGRREDLTSIHCRPSSRMIWIH